MVSKLSADGQYNRANLLVSAFTRAHHAAMRNRMRKLGYGLGIFAWFAASSRADGPAPIEARLTRDQVSLESVSMIGRQVFKEQTGMLIGRSAHFLVMAESWHDVARMTEEAEFAWRWVEKRLGLESTNVSPAWLVAIKSDALWRRITRRHGLRPDGLAMQFHRELYLKDDANQKVRPDRIAHEVIHVRLSNAFPDGLPLWLDEGLAGHWGWLCAAEFQGGLGVALYRNQPALEEQDLMSLRDLLATRRYPFDPRRNRAFYRQSEELVAVLTDRLDAMRFAGFVAGMAGPPGEDPEIQFRNAGGLADSEMLAIISDMRQRCLSPRTF
jgi:hypothetical protein